VLLLPVAFFAGVDEATQLLTALQQTLQVKAVGWQQLGAVQAHGAVQPGCFRVVFSGLYEGCRESCTCFGAVGKLQQCTGRGCTTSGQQGASGVTWRWVMTCCCWIALTGTGTPDGLSRIIC